MPPEPSVYIYMIDINASEVIISLYMYIYNLLYAQIKNEIHRVDLSKDNDNCRAYLLHITAKRTFIRFFDDYMIFNDDNYEYSNPDLLDILNDIIKGT